MSQHSTTETYVYKSVGNTSLKVDVHLPDVTKFGLVASLSKQIMEQASGKQSSSTDSSLPVLVFFHGGGMVGGSKDGWLPQWMFKDALDAGFAVISPEYTLVTPKDAHDTLQDVKDLWTWISEKLNVHLAAAASQHQINPEKIVTTGASAGGYVAYLSALHVLPRPKAIAPIYAMGGDYLTDHYLKPKTEPWMTGVPLMENDDKLKSIINAPEGTHVVRTGLDPAKEPRLSYFTWLIQQGTFLDALTGEPGLSDLIRDLNYEDRMPALPFSTEVLFPQLSPMDKTFPPLIYVHGTADEAVLIGESRSFAKRVKEAGVEVQAVEIEGVNHAWDLGITSSAECKGLERVVPFLLKHVQ